jgi:hypothetical protein
VSIRLQTKLIGMLLMFNAPLVQRRFGRKLGGSFGGCLAARSARRLAG